MLKLFNSFSNNWRKTVKSSNFTDTLSELFVFQKFWAHHHFNHLVLKNFHFFLFFVFFQSLDFIAEDNQKVNIFNIDRNSHFWHQNSLGIVKIIQNFLLSIKVKLSFSAISLVNILEKFDAILACSNLFQALHRLFVFLNCLMFLDHVSCELIKP